MISQNQALKSVVLSQQRKRGHGIHTDEVAVRDSFTGLGGP